MYTKLQLKGGLAEISLLSFRERQKNWWALTIYLKIKSELQAQHFHWIIFHSTMDIININQLCYKSLCKPRNKLVKTAAATLFAAHTQCREQSCGRDPAGSTHYKLKAENYRRGRIQDPLACTRSENSSDWSLLQKVPSQIKKRERCCFTLHYCPILEELHKQRKIQICIHKPFVFRHYLFSLAFSFKYCFWEDWPFNPNLTFHFLVVYRTVNLRSKSSSLCPRRKEED